MTTARELLPEDVLEDCSSVVSATHTGATVILVLQRLRLGADGDIAVELFERRVSQHTQFDVYRDPPPNGGETV